MIRYACSQCRRIITDMRAAVLPDGRLEVQLHCHGAVHRIVQVLDLSGVAFNDGPVLDLPTRDPDEYVRRAQEEGSSSTGRTGRGTAASRRSKNASLAKGGE